MNREELKKILPHREPMLLLDESEKVGEEVVSSYKVRGDEYFLQGHFPDNPIVPGVIQCEMMAQSACILFKDRMNSGNALPVYTGLDKVRFRKQIVPGDLIKIDVKIIRGCHPLYQLSGTVSVEGKKCMSGDFSFAILDKKKGE